MKTKKLLLTAIAATGLAMASLGQTVPNYVPTNGLVGWWPFNGNAIDESINTNDGTVNGATLTTDRFGNPNSAYSFDGVSNIITSQLSVPLQSDWSINFWFKSSNINNNFQGQNILGIGSDTYGWGSAGFQISGQITPGQCPNFTYLNQMYLFDASTQCGGNFLNAGIYNNQWYQIVITKNNLNYQVKINNSTTTSNILQDINIDQLAFGNRAQLPFQYFYGLIDDIGIWNRALTQQEITALYNSSSVGVTEFKNNNLFSVYPNPAKNQLNIKADVLLLNSNYTIYDYTGKLVLSGKLTSENSIIELNNLSQGIYLLTVGDNKKQTFKIVKD
jgi:hypothetical protein